MISRIALMTWILLAPALARMTSNSVFSSTAAARRRQQGRRRPATATGAALTPHLFSSSLIELGDLDDGEVGQVIDDLLLGDLSHGKTPSNRTPSNRLRRV